jgi:MFS transporter, DHA2 family, multidrug resistance protein
MEFYPLFYKWVPAPIKLMVLFILIFAILTCNGIFPGNLSHIAGSRGVYPESLIMAYNSVNIGMGLGLMLAIRFKQRFSSKQLLLSGLIIMLLMNIVCAIAENEMVLIGACLILGFAKVSSLTEIFIIWLLIWSKKLDASRAYPFIYFIALAGGYFTNWYTAWLSEKYDWQYANISIIAILVFCVGLTFFLTEYHSLRRKVPLVQMDFIGLLLLIIFFMLINYVLVYGMVENWFASLQIRWATLCILTSLLLYVLRSYTIKRPVFRLQLFKTQTFSKALLYFILLGIFTTSTLQNSFTGNILQLEIQTNAQLYLYLIPGVFLGAVFCYIWYLRKLNVDHLVAIGFAACMVYHVFMYRQFDKDLSVVNLLFPLIIKGFGIVVSFIAIGLMATSKFEFKLILTGAGMVILIRSFLSNAFFSGIFGYLLYTQKTRHFLYLASVKDHNDQLLLSSSKIRDIFRNLQREALLSATRELTAFIITMGVIILSVWIIVQIWRPNENMKKIEWVD